MNSYQLKMYERLDYLLDLYFMAFPKDSISNARSRILRELEIRGEIEKYRYDSTSDMAIINKDLKSNNVIHWGSCVGSDIKYRICLLPQNDYEYMYGEGRVIG